MSVVSLISLPATYAPNPNFVPPTSKMGWSNFQPISSQPDTAVQLQNPYLTLTRVRSNCIFNRSQVQTVCSR